MLTNGIILILASLGLAQAFFLCLYFLTLKKGDRKSNVFLALILLGLTIRIGKSVLNYYMPLEAWQRNIGISGIFIAGPCLWFYGITLLEKRRPFSRWNYLHFVPFILFLSLIAVIPSSGKFETYWNYGLVVFHLAIYLILSWLFLLKRRSTISKSVLLWYRNILTGVTLVWLYYLGNFLDFNLHYITGPVFYTFLIYAFSYLFLNRHNFSLDKYGSSKLTREASSALFQRVKKLFNDELVFLGTDISLGKVAEKLSVSPREVSQVINENEQQNFYEFVNHYRVEKAKIFLTDSAYMNEKMATIAFDSGFGTVTAFNLAFKKITGITPSAYKKRHSSQ